MVGKEGPADFSLDIIRNNLQPSKEDAMTLQGLIARPPAATK